MRRKSWAVLGAALLLSGCDSHEAVLYSLGTYYQTSELAIFGASHDHGKGINMANCQRAADALNAARDPEEVTYACSSGREPPDFSN